MKLQSLLKKIALFSITKFTLRKYKLYDNFYFIGERTKEIKKILFYFPFYEFMHFGDHLFFEPLIKFLSKAGYKIDICPVSTMDFYFKECGYSVIKAIDVKVKAYDLVISRVELYNKLKNIDNLLMVKTAYSKISQPLCQDLITKVAKILEIPPIIAERYHPVTENDSVIQELFNNLSLDRKKLYVVINFYVDSGSYSVTRFAKQKLFNYVQCFLQQNPNYVALLTGSEKDKYTDKNQYEFDFIDLRGKTSIKDLFTLIQDNSIMYYIGFDGLVMHLANMYEKKSFVMIRKSTKIMWCNRVNHLLCPFPANINELQTIID